MFEFRVCRKDVEIWRWGEHQVITEVITPIAIPGGSPVLYSVDWDFSPADIEKPGDYLVEATFVASGQTA